MTPEELYEKVSVEISIKDIHPLHKAMLEECCENVIKADKNNNFDDKTLINSVGISFIECEKVLKSLIKGAFESLDGKNEVNLTYRNENFKFSKDSYFLK